MEAAAKHNQIYHFWWHPHNFGSNPEKSLHELDFILCHFRTYREKYSLDSLNMHGIAKREIKKYE